MTIPIYADLLALTSRRPVWWDESGVPRFVDFDPELVRVRLAREVALVECLCSSCGLRAWIAVSSAARAIEPEASIRNPISRGLCPRIVSPPELDCCDAPFRIPEPVRIAQFWEQTGAGKWRRESAYEISVSAEARPSDLVEADVGDLLVPVREAWLAGVRAERFRAQHALGWTPAPSPEAMLARWVEETDEEAEALGHDTPTKGATP